MNYPILIQKQAFTFGFELKRQTLSCTSVYLSPDIAEFLSNKLKDGKHKSVNGYISSLIDKYRTVLPMFVPASHKPKKLLQDRIGNRKRFCFSPDSQDYWDLKMIAMNCDTSLGMVVATMLELEMIGFWETLKEIYPHSAITRILNRIEEIFTIKFDPITQKIQRTFHYRKDLLIIYPFLQQFVHPS